MKSAVWLFLIPSAGLVALGATVAVLMDSGTPEWTCICDTADHWRYVGPNGIDESKSHFDLTGHSTSCRRTDRAARIQDKLFKVIFPDHGA